jgi:hypothetical protein
MIVKSACQAEMLSTVLKDEKLPFRVIQIVLPGPVEDPFWNIDPKIKRDDLIDGMKVSYSKDELELSSKFIVEFIKEKD